MKQKAPPEPTTNHAATDTHGSVGYSSVMRYHNSVYVGCEHEVLTVGKRPLWNVKGTDCDQHQGRKLKEPKSENK